MDIISALLMAGHIVGVAGGLLYAVEKGTEAGVRAWNDYWSKGGEA